MTEAPIEARVLTWQERFWRFPLVRVLQYALLVQLLSIPVLFPLLGAAAITSQVAHLRHSSTDWWVLGVSEAVSALCAFRVMSRYPDCPSLAGTGLTWSEITKKRALISFAAGFALAMAMLCGFAAVLLIAGLGRADEGVVSPHTSFLPPLLLSLLVAVAEEAGFRGFALPVLEARWGTATALITSSLLFGLMHLLNPGAFSTVRVTVGLFLATSTMGLVFGAAYLLTRRVWLPIGLHWGWDFLLMFLSGANLSNLNSLFQYNSTDWPVYITQAAFQAVVGLIMLRLAVRRGHWKSRTIQG